MSLGTDRRRCFENPSETEDPNTDIDCPDILPIELQENETNVAAIENPSQIHHPDSINQKRYIVGTRLQTRGKGGKRSHKLKTCQFHNLDLCKQGKEVKTMSQGRSYP